MLPCITFSFHTWLTASACPTDLCAGTGDYFPEGRTVAFRGLDTGAFTSVGVHTGPPRLYAPTGLGIAAFTGAATGAGARACIRGSMRPITLPRRPRPPPDETGTAGARECACTGMLVGFVGLPKCAFALVWKFTPLLILLFMLTSDVQAGLDDGEACRISSAVDQQARCLIPDDGAADCINCFTNHIAVGRRI